MGDARARRSGSVAAKLRRRDLELCLAAICGAAGRYRGCKRSRCFFSEDGQLLLDRLKAGEGAAELLSLADIPGRKRKRGLEGTRDLDCACQGEIEKELVDAPTQWCSLHVRVDEFQIGAGLSGRIVGRPGYFGTRSVSDDKND